MHELDQSGIVARRAERLFLRHLTYCGGLAFDAATLSGRASRAIVFSGRNRAMTPKKPAENPAPGASTAKKRPSGAEYRRRRKEQAQGAAADGPPYTIVETSPAPAGAPAGAQAGAQGAQDAPWRGELPDWLTPGNPGNSGGKAGRSGRPREDFRKWCREAIADPRVRNAALVKLAMPFDAGWASALRIVAAYGHGAPDQKLGLTLEELRDRVKATARVLRRRLDPDLFAELEPELKAIWDGDVAEEEPQLEEPEDPELEEATAA